jgi:hypothetical protein
MEVDRLPSGKRFRFPKCYGIIAEDQGLTVFTELIQVNDIGMSSRISCMARAAALGELAGQSLRAPIDFQFLSRALYKNRPTSRRLHCFGAVLSAEELAEFITLFLQIRERLARARDEYDVPFCLNKGDAQGANLLQCTDGKIVMIDLGGMRNDLIGADLAHLVLTYFGKDQDRLFVDRIDAIAIDAFMAGGALHELGITPDHVRIGFMTQLFYLIYYRMIRKSQELSEKNPDLFATTAADTIETVQKLLRAMNLWFEDMKQLHR